MPVLLMVLERAGIVTREQLAKSRRYAIVVAAAVAAVLTPPDVVSMLLLLVPLYGLYEFAILAIRLTHWRAARRAPRLEPADDVEGPRQMWARKRHRGGEGWRFRAHFDRIARAGGQKVTIRMLKRPLFGDWFRSDLKFFSTLVAFRAAISAREKPASRRCSGRAFGPAASAAGGPGPRRSARTASLATSSRSSSGTSTGLAMRRAWRSARWSGAARFRPARRGGGASRYSTISVIRKATATATSWVV